MNLAELYQIKGELITAIEVAQAKLQSVNQQIVKLINETPVRSINGQDIPTTGTTP